MKVKIGSLLSSHGQTKSSSSVSRSPLSVSSPLSRSFKIVSGSPSKQENTAGSPDKFCITPIEDMEVDATIVRGYLLHFLFIS